MSEISMFDKVVLELEKVIFTKKKVIFKTKKGFGKIIETFFLFAIAFLNISCIIICGKEGVKREKTT